MTTVQLSERKQEIPPDLVRGRIGFLFVSPAIERSYRSWRIEATIDYWRISALLGALCFGVMIPLLYAEDFEILISILPLAVPSTILASLYYLLAPNFKNQRLAMPLGSALTAMIVFGLGWHRHEIAVYESLDSNVLHAAGSVVVGMFFAFCVSRMTPIWAWFAACPGLSLIMYFAHVDYQAGLISDQALLGVAGLMAAGGLIGGFTSLFIERNLRASFSQKQLIARQQERLESTQSAIRRYLPPSVAEKIVAGDTAAVSEPKRLRVTVLFADLVGFTSVADRVEPEVMSQMLNEYLSAMVDIVEDHDGTLNEFAGDGLMAIWGAPNAMQPARQVLNAIRAAEAMQAAIKTLNASWKQLGLDETVSARIGINTGMASVGSYGSRGRVTYTAIGLQTNIACRMESNAPVGGILLSGSSYELVRDEVPCDFFGEIECKGVHFPIKAYVPRGGQRDVVVDMQTARTSSGTSRRQM